MADDIRKGLGIKRRTPNESAGAAPARGEPSRSGSSGPKLGIKRRSGPTDVRPDLDDAPDAADDEAQTGASAEADAGVEAPAEEAAAAEGEGFLLANVYDANRQASHLVILDAENVGAGPLATAYLDHRVPFGFHGNWRQN